MFLAIFTYWKREWGLWAFSGVLILFMISLLTCPIIAESPTSNPDAIMSRCSFNMRLLGKLIPFIILSSANAYFNHSCNTYLRFRTKKFRNSALHTHLGICFLRETKINRPFFYEYNKKELFPEILLMLNNSQMFIQEKYVFIAIKLRDAFYFSNLCIRKPVTQLFK